MASYNNYNTRGLYNYLASFQKLQFLQSWVDECVKAEELKIDYKSFRNMRKEKVLPKRLGRTYSKGADLEAFTAREDQAITQLIKDTYNSKEGAFGRAGERYRTLSREIEPLIADRPSLMEEISSHCDLMVSKAKKEKQKKANHNLKSAISNSRWERMVRPEMVVDMSGGKLTKTERQVLSLGLKFATGLNDRSPLDVATAVNKFRAKHANDPRIHDITFIRASVIPYLNTERHSTLPERYVKALRSLIKKKDLTIISADKGGAVGVLKTTKYYALGMNVLNDADTFTEVQDDDKEGKDVTVMQKAHNDKIRAIKERVADQDMKNVIGRLLSPTTPNMPYMTAYPKLHKDPVKARPVISNVRAPHSRSSKWASNILSDYVGLISGAHMKNTREFHERLRRCTKKGRLLSLDVKSLFTNVPVEEAIDVVRQHSTGNSPIFKNLPIHPELFCELLTVCTSFNQFTFRDQHYRQITGLPMGSSLSPVLANIYMEFFETELMKDIPMDLIPVLWLRYVDDVFCIYEDMSKLEHFLELLNGIRPSIQFTYELSRTDKVARNLPDLPDNVIETIPFLELNVMRLVNGNFTFSIYRKPCHAGNFIHAFSYQPRSHKSSVIRSQFLRAYRFCDTQFLKNEVHTIKQSFLVLGYTSKFIEECRLSAHKGRRQEIQKGNLLALDELPFASHVSKHTEKSEPLATLTLVYHPRTEKLKPRLHEMGIRLAFSTNSTLRQQLKHKSTTCDPQGSVYVVNCRDCTKVYVGQTGKHVEDRMLEHSRGPNYNSSSVGAMHTHSTSMGHEMDLDNPTNVFRSDCNYTRSAVEAALIHVAPTIQGNTATSSTRSDDLVAPVICRSVRFNWENLSNCIPHIDKRSIPRHKRRMFGNSDLIRPVSSNISRRRGSPVSSRLRSSGRISVPETTP